MPIIWHVAVQKSSQIFGTQNSTYPAAESTSRVLHIQMCKNSHMATNLAIDDQLIEEARKTGGHKTKKEAVTKALEEYIRYHKQQKILEDFGTVDFDPTYDYKAARRRKRN